MKIELPLPCKELLPPGLAFLHPDPMIAIQPSSVKAELLQCDLITVVSSDLQNGFR
jgi:hypothetical protein